MRAAIFIDGGYIQTQFKMHGIEPDFPMLADYFLSPLRHSIPLDLLRCYYYYCAPYMSAEPTEDELKRMETHEKFVSELTSMGRWAIRLGKLQKRWEGQREVYEQKRVDVLLSVDLVRHAAAGHIQHAILIAGDSDFVPAVEAAKEHGVTVSLWCGSAKTVHKDLIVLADEVYAFDWSDFPRLNASESAKPARGGGGSGGGSGGSGGGSGGGGRSRRRRSRRPSQRNEAKAEASSAAEDTSGQGKRGGGWSERLKRLTGLSDDND